MVYPQITLKKIILKKITLKNNIEGTESVEMVCSHTRKPPGRSEATRNYTCAGAAVTT